MRYIPILIIVVAWLLAGCSSKSNFYQLHPKMVQKTEKKALKRGTVIGIGEVEVAEYLNKPEIVTRLSAGRIDVHEKERTAGSFPKNIQSVLAHNLSLLLPAYTVLTSPWEEPVSDRYRIYVVIDRFDGDSSGSVAMRGRWSLVDKIDEKVLFGESIDYSLQGGATLDAIVDTQSRLLDRLSRHIAARIRTRL